MALLVISKLLLLRPLRCFWDFRNCCGEVKKGIEEDGKILRSLSRVEKRIDLEEDGKERRQATIESEGTTDISTISGAPEEHMKCRLVRIFQPRKNPMQSGTGNIGHWEIEFEARDRWENPNMGWRSSGDPLSNMGLKFSTKEEAIKFCDKNCWNWYEWKSFDKKKFKPKLKPKKFQIK